MRSKAWPEDARTLMFGGVRDKFGQQKRLIQSGRLQKCCGRFLLIGRPKMKEIKRNDIYYAELDPVVGSEQGGLRPVLILQNDTGNRHSPTTIVAAITSSPRKTNLPTHITVQTKGLTKESIILLEQIRTIDKSRLTEFVGSLDRQTMESVDRAIVVSFGIQYLEALIKWEKEQA